MVNTTIGWLAICLIPIGGMVGLEYYLIWRDKRSLGKPWDDPRDWQKQFEFYIKRLRE